MYEKKRTGRPFNYTVTIECAGKIFTGKGKSIFAALEDLPMDYTNVKNKGNLEVKRGDKSAQMFLNKKPLQRLVVNKLVKAWTAKVIEDMLDKGVKELPYAYKAMK